MLPAHRLARQVLPGYPLRNIDIDADIIAIMLINRYHHDGNHHHGGRRHGGDDRRHPSLALLNNA